MKTHHENEDKLQNTNSKEGDITFVDKDYVHDTQQK